MHVLVVSSDAAQRQRITTALRGRPDVEITEAGSARNARPLLAERDVDVLVIDGDMRPQGGQSLLYEIRADAEYEGVAAPPAIILMGREQDRWLSQWAGAADALVKPVDSFDLAQRVLDLAGVAVAASPGETSGAPLAMDRPSELDRPDAPDPGLASDA